MNSVNGIRKTSVPNYGIFLTARKISANISALSRFPTGLKWMCGNIFSLKIFRCRNFIFRIKEKFSSVTDNGWRILISCRRNQRKLWKKELSVSELSAILPVQELLNRQHRRSKKLCRKLRHQEQLNAEQERMTNDQKLQWKTGKKRAIFNTHGFATAAQGHGLKPLENN